MRPDTSFSERKLTKEEFVVLTAQKREVDVSGAGNVVYRRKCKYRS